MYNIDDIRYISLIFLYNKRNYSSIKVDKEYSFTL